MCNRRSSNRGVVPQSGGVSLCSPFLPPSPPLPRRFFFFPSASFPLQPKTPRGSSKYTPKLDRSRWACPHGYLFFTLPLFRVRVPFFLLPFFFFLTWASRAGKDKKTSGVGTRKRRSQPARSVPPPPPSLFVTFFFFSFFSFPFVARVLGEVGGKPRGEESGRRATWAPLSLLFFSPFEPPFFFFFFSPFPLFFFFFAGQRHGENRRRNDTTPGRFTSPFFLLFSLNVLFFFSPLSFFSFASSGSREGGRSKG